MEKWIDKDLFPIPKKPAIKCWNCGKRDKQKVFGNCPTCRELNMIPAFFCSDECYRKSWTEHKTYHEKLLVADAKDEDPMKYTATTPYTALVADGLRLSLANRRTDAKRVFRKAIKLDPREGGAFFSLSRCYIVSGHFADAVALILAALRKRALSSAWDLVFGKKKGINSGWFEALYTLCDLFLRNKARQLDGEAKPQWLIRDGLFCKVSAVFIPSLQYASDAHAELYLQFYAYACIGIISNGEMSNAFPPPDDRSPDDLRIGMKCARHISSESNPMIDFDAYEAVAVARENNPRYKKKAGIWWADVSDGVWLTIGGLPEDEESWNGKVAVVSGAQDMNTEEWPVKIDGVENIQMVREENLLPLPFYVGENFAAIAATIDKGVEAEILWDLMRRMVAKKSRS